MSTPSGYPHRMTPPDLGLTAPKPGRHPLRDRALALDRRLLEALLFSGNGTYHRAGLASGRRRDLADGRLDVRVVHGGRRPPRGCSPAPSRVP